MGRIMIVDRTVFTWLIYVYVCVCIHNSVHFSYYILCLGWCVDMFHLQHYVKVLLCSLTISLFLSVLTGQRDRLG